MIKLRKVTKTYQMGQRTQTVLHAVDVDIAENELIAIMGASGSGKSTLMNIIGLLDRPTSGTCHFNEREIGNFSDDEMASLRNRMIGFVFQQFFLLPRLNALQNVILPLTYRHENIPDMHDRAMTMLEKVGMSDHWHHLPSELSGGQQQRVAIALALVGTPDVILADEPTGALDSKTGQEVMDLFLELNKVGNTTVIIVTHDPKIGEQCRRVIHISDGKITDGI